MSRTEKSSILNHPVVVSWLITLFLCIPLLVWCDFLFLILAFTIVPIVTLGVWLAGVPLWLLWGAFVRLLRREWLEALSYLAVLPIGVAVAVAGLKCGDFIAVMTYGSLLRNAVEAVKMGAAPKKSNGIFASSTMAFALTGGFLDISTGIVYDPSGLAGKMLALPPAARPETWQKNAVDVLSCQGSARHLFGDFYKVTVSSYSC